MKYKNKILNIKKEKIKRKIFLKLEIKKILLKSIIQNKNLKPKVRALALFKFSKYSPYSSISKQKNNICLKTGKIKSVLKLTNLSRHALKEMSVFGNLQNIKITTW